ncbi:uncharacterized protein LOC118480243 [Helianthus annuus]|uniref:uncharacterized protein LOC118480243 n=1 Tax=Helianthus annuus TaxID=4232 RepID=UPI001652F7EA|nr:uncharacterized protein LOC118480243 [Helianthus annuus]
MDAGGAEVPSTPPVKVVPESTVQKEGTAENAAAQIFDTVDSSNNLISPNEGDDLSLRFTATGKQHSDAEPQKTGDEARQHDAGPQKSAELANAKAANVALGNEKAAAEAASAKALQAKDEALKALEEAKVAGARASKALEEAAEKESRSSKALEELNAERIRLDKVVESLQAEVQAREVAVTDLTARVSAAEQRAAAATEAKDALAHGNLREDGHIGCYIKVSLRQWHYNERKHPICHLSRRFRMIPELQIADRN